MKSFNDSAGRSWTIAMNIDAAKRVRDLLQINLLEPEAGNPPLLTRLATDEILLCDVFYCLCKPEADKLGVSDSDFGKSLGGDAILSAQTAFYEELADFFLKRGRTDRAKAIQAQAKMIQLAVKKVELQLNNLNLDEEADKIFGNSSTS